MKTIGNIIHHKLFPLVIRNPNGDTIYYEHLNGAWGKQAYDENRHEIYYENSSGHIEDDRP